MLSRSPPGSVWAAYVISDRTVLGGVVVFWPAAEIARWVIVLCALATAAATLGSRAVHAVEIDFETIAIPGDPAPSATPGSVFSSISSVPVISELGHVAFGARMPDPSRNGIWLRDPEGGLRLVIESGGQAPGFDPGTTVNGAFNPSINASADVLARGTVNPTGDPIFRTLWFAPEGHSVGPLLTEGLQAPVVSTGIVFDSSPAGAALTDDRGTAFYGTVRGPGVTGSNDEIVWSGRLPDALEIFMREGTRPHGMGFLARLQIISKFATNRRGEVALYGSFSTPTTVGNAIWGPGADGSPTLLVRSGDPAPGGGLGDVFFRFDRDPWLGDDGTLVFQAELIRVEPRSSVYPMVWYRTKAGDLDALLRVGEPMPSIGREAHISYSSQYAMGPGGRAVGLGRVQLTPGGKRHPAIWEHQLGEPPSLLAVTGVEVPGFSESVDLPQIFAFALSKNGDVLFVSGAPRAPRTVSDYEELHFVQNGGLPVRILGAGDLFEVSPGVVKTVKMVAIQFGGSPGSESLNTRGEVVFRAGFADGTYGIFLARMPVMDDGDGDSVPDLVDNCPEAANSGQADLDGNRIGDACNDFEDRDGDDIADELDICPDDPDSDQSDLDADGLGDACNDAVDSDGDDYRDEFDNCPDTHNDQLDSDGDGLGDPCDPFPFDADHEKGQLRQDLEMCEDALEECLARRIFVDQDGDGEEDSRDQCLGTLPGEAIDGFGCSRDQFCDSANSIGRFLRLKQCTRLDWNNDEPTRVHPGDCKLEDRWFWFIPLDVNCVPK